MLKLLFVFLASLGAASWAQASPGNHLFKTSDGVSLNYMQAGHASRSIVFVPGWLMPAEIFKHQLNELSQDYRVIVLDPRGQGRSQAKVKDMSAQRRAKDIKELIQHLKLKDYVLAGWSLGVMEILETVERHPLPGLRGLVLIDNSIGMGPAKAATAWKKPMKAAEFQSYVERFATAIFKQAPTDGLVEVIVQSATRLPPKTAWQLLDKPHDRSYYKNVILSTSMPVWYAITPRYSPQADELLATRVDASMTLFPEAGHALFVDSAPDFNAQMRQFMQSLDRP